MKNIWIASVLAMALFAGCANTGNSTSTDSTAVTVNFEQISFQLPKNASLLDKDPSKTQFFVDYTIPEDDGYNLYVTAQVLENKDADFKTKDACQQYVTELVSGNLNTAEFVKEVTVDGLESPAFVFKVAQDPAYASADDPVPYSYFILFENTGDAFVINITADLPAEFVSGKTEDERAKLIPSIEENIDTVYDQLISSLKA